VRQGRKPPLPSMTKARAKKLRQQLADAETKLWYYLRAGRLSGLKFRRQHPVPPYIVDFYCEGAKLAVELDGSRHCEQSDMARQEALERGGMKLLRFWDSEILQDTEAVLAVILNMAQARTLTPAPLPKGEGIE
jgi:very-short-patch-repair endonuclease